LVLLEANIIGYWAVGTLFGIVLTLVNRSINWYLPYVWVLDSEYLVDRQSSCMSDSSQNRSGHHLDPLRHRELNITSCIFQQLHTTAKQKGKKGKGTVSR